jgi:hypothetical protein
MTVGSIIGGDPIPGKPNGMSSMLIDGHIDNCVFSTGLKCEEGIGGLQTFTSIPDMTYELLAPLDNMILSYRCTFV